jgi:CMP-N-acetylneuraminic acid synthetase
MMGKPVVTVYVPCHNYGRFLAQAVDSVLEQSFAEWELIIIDDGSQDETAEIANRYATLHPFRIQVMQHTPARGLRACANRAIEAARGDYIMRLDADDYLDENALLVMVNYLNQHPDVALVYPNYTYVNEQGDIIGLENRKKIGKEVKVLDLPAHGACTLIRKRALKAVGGYSENRDAQDGYELWLKVLHRYPVGNVSTPLFFYRQHGNSMSVNEQHILGSRRRIKRGLVERNGGAVKPRIVAVVPAKNTYAHLPNVVLAEFTGRPLIDYTLEAAQQSNVFETIFVSTDDPQVVEHCASFEGVLPFLRSPELSSPRAHLSHVLYDAVHWLEGEYGVYADILVVLSLHSPLRRPEHIQQAIDTLLLYNVDNVISVYEDRELHFTHGEYGLEPLNKGMLQRLRLEREALYVNNGAIYALWRDVVAEEDLFGRKIGHVVMPLEESYQIKSAFDLWMIEQVMNYQRDAVLSR